MYIEDLFITMAHSTISFNSFDRNLILSLYNQIITNVQLTEKQGSLILRILKKYKSKIELALKKNIDTELDDPKFKNSFRIINTLKTINIVNDPAYEKLIKVQFPYDETIISKFKQQRLKLFYCAWNDDKKSWFLSLDESSIQLLMTLLNDYNFMCDDEFLKYVDQINAIQKNIEKHVPMLVKNRENFDFINVTENFPKNTSSDILETLFYARKLGIYTWDDAIDEEINSSNFDPEVKNFLKSNPGEPYSLFLNDHPLISIKNVIRHLLPCLVIISPGSELRKLESSMNFFQTLGIDNSEISVLFRLSSSENKEFNDYVKNHKLNSPVTDNTKVIFINDHIPKTILEPKKTFYSVLNYNYYVAHYKMKDFLRYQPNVINILENHK